MKQINKVTFFVIIILHFFTTVQAQVPQAGELLGLHNVINTDIPTITTPIAGSLLYNGTDETVEVYKASSTSWEAIGTDNFGNHTATQNINTNNNWISNGGSSRGIYLATNGRVGFGTNNPQREIHVNNGGVRLDRTSNSAFFMLHRKTNSGVGLKTFFFGVNASGVNNGTFFIGDMGANTGGPNAQRLVINNMGNVGINNTNPSVRLDVGGSIEYTGTITNVSDKRLKKSIRQLPSSLSKIESLNPVSYQYRSLEFPQYDFNEKTQLGLIAQEVEEVIPELVSDNEDGFKQLNYIGIIPLLIKSVQEQQNIINTQNSIIEKLIERVEKIESKLN